MREKKMLVKMFRFPADNITTPAEVGIELMHFLIGKQLVTVTQSESEAWLKFTIFYEVREEKNSPD